ncbi:nickel-responsive transcriptional regulator NikR [Halalkalibacter okhensis]|uniref:Putative nickel-responsive regulator n=1 Tax=Halalkalibacter okhensis TaxID=333138 RepID=A0A0B0ICJ3_9BACI|nr:nickel-responsive transcriptional regulator NikR [Halalkalibacter okhensis]KHF38617.1 NAD+ synthetase [Halalkalibacter okhensis]
MSNNLSRFGVAMPQDLVKKFDKYLTKKGYSNRSEALRDLARRVVLESEQSDLNKVVAGTIVIIYDHHQNNVVSKIMNLQHDYHEEIISTMHIHLTHAECLEVLVVRGKKKRLVDLHEIVEAQKGVTYSELSVTFIDNSEDEE